MRDGLAQGRAQPVSLALRHGRQAAREFIMHDHIVRLQQQRGFALGLHGHALRAVRAQRRAGARDLGAALGTQSGPGVAQLHRDRQRPVRPRIGVRVGADQHIRQRLRVLHAVRIPAYRVQGFAGQLHAVAEHAARTGLETHDPAERGRTDHRAPRLRAQGDRDHACRHRGRGTAGRTAGRMPRRMRIAGGAGSSERELGGHRLADGNGAGGAQHPHAAGIESGGACGQGRCAETGRHVRHVNDVLDADGHAGQRAGGVHGRVQLVQFAGGHDVAPRQHTRVQPFDGRKALARRVRRPGFAGSGPLSDGDD
ncbi:hypothetical protein D3C86_1198920 [compost metagenome]